MSSIQNADFLEEKFDQIHRTLNKRVHMTWQYYTSKDLHYRLSLLQLYNIQCFGENCN